MTTLPHPETWPPAVIGPGTPDNPVRVPMGKLRFRGNEAVKENMHKSENQSCTLAFLFAVSVIWGKLLNFSDSRFLHPKK